MSPDDPRDLELLESFRAREQGQVFHFLPDLAPNAAKSLLAQARSIDLDLLERLCRETGAEDHSPPDLAPVGPVREAGPRGAAAREAGSELLSKGKVGLYTVAGGQGTRLGFDGPKGCYRLPTPSSRPLFAWHAEKILAASRRHGVELPWVILVSEANAEITREHFEENDWYGLTGRIRFVRQKMLPAVDGEGTGSRCSHPHSMVWPW